ncbi:MAG: DNA alkylation repair protein [Oscillospiraceae bacterium]|nr:DNA alkylation repair protein [Oscillospiraceae bacterium]
MTVRERLFALRDGDYAAFQAKLTPGVAPEAFIGVRVPELRKLAKELAGSPEAAAFLAELPHEYYDENMLHGLLVTGLRGREECIIETERFLPYVDNWAVCDTLAPRALAEDRPALLRDIRRWAASEKVYTCRFGIGMLMRFFLDSDFSPELLEIPAAVRSEEYYVRMMVAWFFATALAKQWDAALPYIEGGRLDKWTHNKTISKTCESFRVPAGRKELLRGLRR